MVELTAPLLLSLGLGTVLGAYAGVRLFGKAPRLDGAILQTSLFLLLAAVLLEATHSFVPVGSAQTAGYLLVGALSALTSHALQYKLTHWSEHPTPVKGIKTLVKG